MTALVQYGFGEFTGPNIGSLDRLPAFIPVPGYDRRFVAQHFQQLNDGATVTAWVDTEVSGTSMTAAGSGIVDATSPTLGTVSGHRVVRFDGVKNALGILYVNPEPYTFTTAFYLPAPVVNAFMVSVSDVGQFALFTNGAGIPAFYGNGRATAPNALAAGWHIITVVANGANTRIRIDDSEAFTYTSGGAYDRRRLTLGGSSFNANRARFDVVEEIHWPKALDTTEVGNVHAVLKSRYGI